MTQEEMSRLANEAAYALGQAIGAVKFAADLGDQRVAAAIEAQLRPEHLDLLACLRTVGTQVSA